MTKLLKNVIKWSLYLLVVAAFCGVVVEYYVRNVFLQHSPLSRMEMRPGRKPHFGLTAEFDEHGTTIRNHRREALPRGKRNKSVAFIGDSFTFCPGIKNEECFVEKIQKAQTQFDAYNFGVPGYGLAEYPYALKEALSLRHFDAVSYLFVFNDFFDAQPVLFSLTQNPKDRFDSLERFEGRSGALKLFLKDHFRTAFVFRYLAGWYIPTSKLPPAPILGSVAAPKEQVGCYERLKEQVKENLANKRTTPIRKKALNDPAFLKRIGDRIAELRDAVENQGGKFIVTLAPELVMYIENERASYDALVSQLQKRNIAVNDIYEKLKAHLHECGVFLENDFHYGPVGNDVLAETILPRIQQLI